MREPAKDPVDIGQVAYEAYCDYVGWKSVRGEELPGFSQQEPRLQNAWRLAAEAAAPHLEAAARERIAGPVRELLAAAMDYFNEMGAHVAYPPDEWTSEARYAQAEAVIASLLRQGGEGGGA